MGTAGLMADKRVPDLGLDAGFPKLKNRIIERTGHFYYQDKDDLLWERVRKRLHASGLRDCSQYLGLLDDPVAGEAEWVRLEAEITIGETFFFRYAEQFAALRETILPEIVERKRHERRLRVWSAGCATGAEPYSLAILIHELLGEDLPNWRVNIVGTDINEGFLATARRGRFGKWALRALSAEQRAGYFAPAEREQWQLRPEYKSLVRFEKHNLLSLLDGTSPLQFSEFDLILCRNVLIYFHPDTVTRIVGALRDCLLDDGWMLLGHAEPNPTFASMMQALSLPGTVAYRRNAADLPILPVFPGQPPSEPAWAPSLPETRRPARRESPARSAKAKVLPAKPVPDKPLPVAIPGQTPDGLLDEVRKMADAGDFRAAHDLCRRALLEQPLSAALHFYQGLISQALNRPAEAQQAFRRSLYLDKSFAMAHYHLGLLLLANGQAGPGRRALANAARIVGTLPENLALAEADGATAKDLRNLIRVHLGGGARIGQRG
jgi:chemotaxis protein methyltransferase CheR